MKRAASKKKRVHKRREVVMYNFIHRIAGPVLYWLMRFTCKQVTGVPPRTLILCNHTTDLDPVLIARAFPQYVRFVASEHIFRWGFFSKLLTFVFSPIMRLKGTTDARTVLEVLRTLKAGKTVCIFPEGARSFNGVTGPVPQTTGKLLAASGANLITYRIVGGFFAQPGWAKTHRRGKVYGEVVGRYSAAELAAMTTDEINALIARDLREDAYGRQRELPVVYKGRRRAENMELAAYVCPACGRAGTIGSKGNRFFCEACGLEGAYTDTGFLEGRGLPFDTLAAWDEWQKEQLALLAQKDTNWPLLTDERQTLWKIVPKKRSERVEKGTLTLYRDRLVCGNCTFLLDAISDVTNCSKMTLTFSTKKGSHYEIKSPYPRSAIKYAELFHMLVDRRAAQEADAPAQRRAGS